MNSLDWLLNDEETEGHQALGEINWEMDFTLEGSRFRENSPQRASPDNLSEGNQSYSSDPLLQLDLFQGASAFGFCDSYHSYSLRPSDLLEDEFQRIFNGSYSNLVSDADQITNVSSNRRRLSEEQEVLPFISPEVKVIDLCGEATPQKIHRSYSPVTQNLFQGDCSGTDERSNFMSEASVKRLAPLKNGKNEITYDDISLCFRMPINDAAKKLHVGVTQLKKRCRDLNIRRWPYRKIKSMKTLAENLQGLVSDGGEAEGEIVRRTVEMLEEDRKAIQRDPGKNIDEETKKLRQACFRAKFNKTKLKDLRTLVPCLN